ncbi:hypothetical protein M501DRAFT_1012679 [Patellaria atrata CBS 101060]|uniref:Uncharacterized protein n=1 Tax=Patellaria atrata CBS 101060 TaxID=1346257 RepID=A0A9P4SJ75_9PEZI|nr:hypothetical protein M501DRAFT_1012679 [Patellaria atrata CBS 101060]
MRVIHPIAALLLTPLTSSTPLPDRRDGLSGLLENLHSKKAEAPANVQLEANNVTVAAPTGTVEVPAGVGTAAPTGMTPGTTVSDLLNDLDEEIGPGANLGDIFSGLAGLVSERATEGASKDVGTDKGMEDGMVEKADKGNGRENGQGNGRGNGRGALQGNQGNNGRGRSRGQNRQGNGQGNAGNALENNAAAPNGTSVVDPALNNTGNAAENATATDPAKHRRSRQVRRSIKLWE